MGLGKRIRSTSVIAALALVGGLMALVEPAAAAGTGAIRGTVTVPGGVGAPALTVAAYATPVDASPTAAATTTLAGSGSYLLSGLDDGSYLVVVTSATASPVAGEFYGGTRTQADAMSVVVTGAEVTGIDVALDKSGQVSGTVTRTGGTAVVGATVAAYPSGTPLEQMVNTLSTATTAANGEYTMTGIGEHRLVFLDSADTGVNGVFSGGTSTPDAAVTVAVNSDAVTTFNQEMPTDITISGTVRDVNGDPIPNVCVIGDDASYWWDLGDGESKATTASDGTYTLRNLRPGAIAVGFMDCGGSANVVTEWWNDKPTALTADRLTLAAGATASAIDPVLATGGIIAGSFDPVQDQSGSTCTVQAWNLATLVTESSAGPPATLTSFSLIGLPVGSFTLRAICVNGGTTTYERWYDGAATQGTATPVAATSGNITTITFHDAPPVDSTPPTISGAATTAPNGNGWYNAAVTVHFSCADTGGSGLASCTADQVLSAEGAAQSVAGTASDVAGNSASATVSGINIDLTKPTITPSGNAGSYTTAQAISIGCTATDALSGIDTTDCATVSYTAGSLAVGSHSITWTATDKAGNTASASATFTVNTPTAPPVTTPPTTTPPPPAAPVIDHAALMAFYNWIIFIRFCEWIVAMRKAHKPHYVTKRVCSRVKGRTVCRYVRVRA